MNTQKNIQNNISNQKVGNGNTYIRRTPLMVWPQMSRSPWVKKLVLVARVKI